MIPWWSASILANLMILVVEYINRTGGYPTFGHTILRTGIFIVIAQYGLWRAWSGAPSMMFAWAFFAAGNVVLRALSSHFWVGEPLGWQATVGMTMVFTGAWLIKGSN